MGDGVSNRSAPIAVRILLVRLRQMATRVFTARLYRLLRARQPAPLRNQSRRPASIVLNNPHLDDVIIAPRRAGPAGLDDLKQDVGCTQLL
jgi:hypothetical protein